MSVTVDRLVDALELAGCKPWQAHEGCWYAWCPTCRRAGIQALVEIRRTEAGTLVTCLAAHEPLRRLGRLAA